MAVRVEDGSTSSFKWKMSIPEGMGMARTPRAFIRVDLPHPWQIKRVFAILTLDGVHSSILWRN